MDKLIKKQEILFAELFSSIKGYYKESKRKTKTYMKKRLKKTTELWQQIENLHKQILSEISPDNPTEAENEYFKSEKFIEAEDLYLIFAAELEEKLNPEDIDQQRDTPKSPESAESSSLKLPRITLPKFGGDYGSWVSFRDLFLSLIHNKQTLSKTEKLHYLKASLTCEAEHLIQGFAVTETNYETAWEILCNRYENKRMLVNSQLDIIFSQNHYSESSESIKKLLDTTVESVQSLKNMKINDLWDCALVYVISKKLPRETLQLWEQQISNKNEIPSFDSLKSFLETRFRTLEAIGATKIKGSSNGTINKVNVVRRQTFLAERKLNCSICNENHPTRDCRNFINLPFSQKNETVRRLGLCINCLNRGHLSHSCPSRFSCKHCGKRHHSTMHIFTQNNSSMNVNASNFIPNPSKSEKSHSESSQNPIQAMLAHTHKEVLLTTAIVVLKGPWGNEMKFRALLDPGSQASFITEHAVQALGLRKYPVRAAISGIGQSGTDISKARVMVEISPPHEHNQVLVEAFVLKTISNNIPSKAFQYNDWTFIKDIHLADPTFNKPGKIDLLLGADVYPNLLLDGIKRGLDDHPIALNTILGWVLCGEVSTRKIQEPTPAKTVISANITIKDLSDQLQSFWRLEELSKPTTNLPEEEECEKHFKQTHRRLPDGRYIVRLPFKNEEQKGLGLSRNIAVANFLQLERRLSRNLELKGEYSECLNEYLHLGHMHLIDSNTTHHIDSISNQNDYKHYYMPHHAVFKDSTTTKLRVVFNASQKTTSGLSLNDVLLTGPPMQNDLIRVFLQWRKYKYSFIADIEKMYRQVKVPPEDANYQRIIWRNKPDERLQDYCLNTVTFGVTCAPYLAMRVLKQLSIDEVLNYPIGAKAIEHELYVDDLLSGEETLDKATEKVKQINLLLQSGGFKLRKWMSNHASILNLIPLKDRAINENVSLNIENGIKSLGLLWYPKTDTLGYKVNTNFRSVVKTKRELLSAIASVYDPLGCLAPVIIMLKILMQAVWIHGLEWDEELPLEITNQFNKIRSNICELENLRIPRWLNTSSYVKVELHAFSDASQRAYAAVLYVRTISTDGIINAEMLLSKSKVAPVKPVSIPRLELCAVVLSARLIQFSKAIFEVENEDIHIWTDSEIVLSWLNKHPSKWTTFVSNRTSEIFELIGETSRRHVPSADNPADLASRGLLPKDMADNELWWHGPEWLRKSSTYWPKQKFIPETDLEQRRNVLVHLATKDNYLFEVLPRFSSFTKLLRTTVYCIRFMNRIRGKPCTTESITSNEIISAQIIWIRLIQASEFDKELQNLEKTQNVNKASKIANLYPFLDKDGLIRVGGRLQNAALSFDERIPIILPKSGHLISLILRHYHNITLHGGSQLMLNTMRKRYWLLDARNGIRRAIHQCVTCYRHKTELSTQLMGNLPNYRVMKCKPFTNTGVDYCGPITLRMSKHRGAKTYKGYIAIFICLAVKAVHIEPVSDMTANAFIAAFYRFTARRGLCKNIYSDCGTNFVGANAIFKEIAGQNKRAAEKFVQDGIDWHFIPPSSPHFGGIWESSVKSAKYHLKRILGNAVVTFEELCTILYQIESCMNSRPLCPLTSDPSDTSALTPGHFLTGDALLAPPQNDLLPINTNRLDRWRLAQQLVQHFWNRWSKEYLTSLQQRTKWKTLQRNIKRDHIVLVKDDRFPPNKWPLGRVIKTHAGNDGLTRVVTVRTQGGDIKRPIVKIALLPISDNQL